MAKKAKKPVESDPSKKAGYDDARKDIEAVEHALRAGHHPTGLAGSHEWSAIRTAAEARDMKSQSLRERVGTPKRRGSYERRYGLSVDWSLYKASPADEVDYSVLEKVRLKNDLERAKKYSDNLAKELIGAREYRSSILKLAELPELPKLVIPSFMKRENNGRTAVLHLSDVHMGETVSIDEMDGLNRYDMAVCRTRLGRFFGISGALLTKHWAGKPPDEIVLCLGGDLISGLIHDELLETNGLSIPHQVRIVGELIADGIQYLRHTVKVPIRVYSVPGNHARPFLKPRSKGRASQSFDLLATDFAAAALRNDPKVKFYQTNSPDAHFSTYGWHWMLTHGDTMGGRGGGTGFIGPMASIIKGHRKLVDTSWRSGRPVHFVLTAHYHTTGRTPFGWANGSVIGYGEYARDLRADPEPARQNMLVVHAERGVINEQPLYLGDPSEGSLYAGPASVIRPTWEEAA